MKKKQNVNLLKGMACPGCRSLGPFQIYANVSAKVSDATAEPKGELQWSGENECCCSECGDVSTVKDYTVSETEAALRTAMDVIERLLTWAPDDLDETPEEWEEALELVAEHRRARYGSDE